MTKISIIVPVYNTEEYLPKCLDSLVNQSFDDYEIIMINDGSTDKSANLIKKYDSPKIKLLNKKNEGQALARNLGIKEAQGDYIMFVDSDDYIDKDTLKIAYEKATHENADIVCFNNYLVIDNVVTNDSNKKTLGDNDNKTFIINNPGPCFKLIRTNIIKDNNLYFPHLKAYEDIAVVPSYTLFSKKTIYIQDKLYYYVIREGSTMKQLEYSAKLEEIFMAMENLLKVFKNNSAYQLYEPELEYLYIYHLLHDGGLRFLEFKKYDQIKKINQIMKNKFPKWRQNKYYRKQTLKYRIMCNLLLKEKFKLISLLKK